MTRISRILHTRAYVGRDGHGSRSGILWWSILLVWTLQEALNTSASLHNKCSNKSEQSITTLEVLLPGLDFSVDLLYNRFVIFVVNCSCAPSLSNMEPTIRVIIFCSQFPVSYLLFQRKMVRSWSWFSYPPVLTYLFNLIHHLMLSLTLLSVCA